MGGNDDVELEHILALGILNRQSYDLSNMPVRNETTWPYLVVHSDGSLTHRTGGIRGIIDYLNYSQDNVHGEGELGTEDLADLPGIDAAWIGPYYLDRLPDNPVANRMIQVFDLGKVPGEARGNVAFTPALNPGWRHPLDGYRLELVLKVHEQIRSDLAAGREPRERLWPSEMITASRGIAPQEAWQEFQRVRAAKDPDVKITDLIRQREADLRAGRDPDHRS